MIMEIFLNPYTVKSVRRIMSNEGGIVEMDYRKEIIVLIEDVQSEKHLKYIYDLIKTLLDETI